MSDACVVLHAVAHGPRHASAVALTFDDGPGAVTAAILEVLRRHGARATFNVLGEKIAAREHLLRRAVREHHEIGVHGWNHGDHRDRPIARARAAADVADVVVCACGVRPRLFRPPFGATNRRLQLAAARHGLKTVLWDVDPRDFEEPGAQAIYARTIAAIRRGSIVLLHDDRPELAPTAQAVDRLLDDLANRGWQAVTVSELLAGRQLRRSASALAAPSGGTPRR